METNKYTGVTSYKEELSNPAKMAYMVVKERPLLSELDEQKRWLYNRPAIDFTKCLPNLGLILGLRMS